MVKPQNNIVSLVARCEYAPPLRNAEGQQIGAQAYAVYFFKAVVARKTPCMFFAHPGLKTIGEPSSFTVILNVQGQR